MELIKKLNEDAQTSIDRDTFDRLVRHASEEIKDNMKTDLSTMEQHTDDLHMTDIILGIIENIAGFEDTDEAAELARRVLREVKRTW